MLLPKPPHVWQTEAMTETVPSEVIRSLCSVHREHAFGYRNLIYSPHNPTEWPGGAHIMDNRTDHETRRKDWERKSEEQVKLIVSICRSGRSPQCTHTMPEDELAEALIAESEDGTITALFERL